MPSCPSTNASSTPSEAKTPTVIADTKKITAIHIVGGGSKDDYLDNMTAKICGVPVLAGPTECSSIGNILSQMICEGVYTDITSARKAVADSFELKTYKGE